MGLFSNIEQLRTQAKQFADNGQDGEAIKLYRKLIKKDPSFSNLYAYRLGNLYGYGGPFQDDEEALLWYAKVKPNTVSKEKYCDVLRYQGNINRQLGRTEKALSFYEEADRLEDPVTQNVLGLLYHYGDGFEQNTDKAIHYYKRAIQNGSTDAMINLSDIYKKSPDTLYEAITLLTDACGKGHNDAEEWLNKVFNDTSTQELRTLCRTMPEDKKYGDEHFQYLSERARRDDNSCFYAYAMALKKRGQTSKAIEAFKKSPASKIGDSYYELGKLTEGEESAEYFEKCIQYGLDHEITSTTQKAMTKLALHYKKSGQTSKAIQYNEMVISHGYSLGYLRLGEIYREMNLESAEDYFLRAYNDGRKKAAMYLYEYAYARNDYTAAKKWCDETPQKEGNQKLYRLALLTWYGQGTEKDEEKAIDLLKQAIETKDSPGLSAEYALFGFYAHKETVDFDTFKQAYKLYSTYKEIHDFVTEDFSGQYRCFRDRVEKYYLQEDPSWRGHFTLAGHYLSNEILEPDTCRAVQHIIEGLGYSWDDAGSLYVPPQYPEELDSQFLSVFEREIIGVSRYELIKLYGPLAEKGHVESMYRLFNQLIKVTKYGTPEYEEVSKWFKKAEKCGHPALQKSMDPLIGFIAQSASATKEFMLAKPYHTEAIVHLAKRCEENGDQRHLTAARLLYLAAVKQYKSTYTYIVRKYGARYTTNGYRYYCIYNLYCNSLIKDEEKAQEWLERMSGYSYPPARLVWLRQHNPLPMYRYSPEDRQWLRETYQEIIAWGEPQAEAYL